MIFRELRDLEKDFEQGTIPEPEELQGEHYVVIPWFPWVSLEPLKHRKEVLEDGKGSNVLLSGFRFGHFNLEKEADSLLINYDNPENPRVLRRAIDRVRRLPDGRLVGKFYYPILGREIFINFFELRPKEK